PGECRFIVEWRPIPSQRTEIVPEKVRSIIQELGFEAEVTVQRMDRGVETSVASEGVAFVAWAGGEGAAEGALGARRAQMTQLGAEAVVFGPGNIQVAHQTGEFVPVDELVRAEEVLEQAIVRFCGGA